MEPGDKVILFTSSTPETVFSILALCRIGAVANMINPLFTADQICDRINETGAKLLLVLDQLFEKISGIIQNTSIEKTVVLSAFQEMPVALRLAACLKKRTNIPYSDIVISWNKFLNGTAIPKNTDDFPYEKDYPLIMVYSSGTTGASKGIVLTNDGINATISNYENGDFFYNRGDSFLQIIPVWFSTGIVLSVLMPLRIGITVILEPIFSKESFAQDLRKYHPNMTLAATSLWTYAVQSNTLKKCDLSSLKYPITGGEQVLPRVEVSINGFLKEHGCNSPLLKGYGMCELGSTVSTDSQVHRKAGATGFPIIGVTVAAFDMETDHELRYGERGEIRVLSLARMKEYFQKPEATNNYFYIDEFTTLSFTGSTSAL